MWPIDSHMNFQGLNPTRGPSIVQYTGTYISKHSRWVLTIRGHLLVCMHELYVLVYEVYVAALLT